jgi:hypothetical protein
MAIAIGAIIKPIVLARAKRLAVFLSYTVISPTKSSIDGRVNKDRRGQVISVLFIVLRDDFSIALDASLLSGSYTRFIGCPQVYCVAGAAQFPAPSSVACVSEPNLAARINTPYQPVIFIHDVDKTASSTPRKAE